jgi:MHS family proline/betaine transporter-like MFS transporter
MIGNALEYYDFFLYSFFVSIIAPHFFPASDPLSALLMGFGVFAVGFLTRPLGAVFFGHFGDKYGRKVTLLSTLLLMALATVGIGLLPPYEQIGLFATFFLVLFRLLQGFAAGGEVNGVAVFSLEQTPSGKQGFIGAFMTSSAGVGAIMATLMGLIFTHSLMPEWAWRIPFCLGGFVACVGFYLRRSLNEVKTRKTVKMPLADILQNHFLSFLKAMGIGGFLHVPFYIIVGYMNPTMHAKGMISNTELMVMNMAVTLIGALLIPLLGHFSDKIGHRRMMTWGALGQILCALPVFMIYTTGSFSHILWAQIGLLMVAEAFVAPSNAYLNTLFPEECRYSGVAFGVCLGTALFGGTTPLLCNQLAVHLDPLGGPALYLMGTALLGLWAVVKLKTTSHLGREVANLRNANE